MRDAALSVVAKTLQLIASPQGGTGSPPRYLVAVHCVTAVRHTLPSATGQLMASPHGMTSPRPDCHVAAWSQDARGLHAEATDRSGPGVPTKRRRHRCVRFWAEPAHRPRTSRIGLLCGQNPRRKSGVSADASMARRFSGEPPWVGERRGDHRRSPSDWQPVDCYPPGANSAVRSAPMALEGSSERALEPPSRTHRPGPWANVRWVGSRVLI